MSKEPVFVSIVCEDEDFNNLSGKYNFHSIKNKAVVYVRDGGKISLIDPHPYFLSYSGRIWGFHGADDLKTLDLPSPYYWIYLQTQGLY